MKLKLFLIIGIICLGAIVIADTLLTEERSVDIKTKELLDSASIRQGYKSMPSYTVPPLNCSTERCETIKVGIKGLGTMTCNVDTYWIKTYRVNNRTVETKFYYTDEELKEQLISCERDWLKRIALRENITQEREIESFSVIQDSKEVSVR